MFWDESDIGYIIDKKSWGMFTHVSILSNLSSQKYLDVFMKVDVDMQFFVDLC